MFQSIDELSLEGMRTTFTRNTANLIFRRVHRVMVKPEDLLETIVEKIVDGKSVVTRHKAGEPKPEFTAQEWLQNVEVRYSKFFFFTSATPLRGNDKIYNMALYGASNNYRELDFTDGCNFLFSPVSGSGVVPPRVGDLVCGLVMRGQNPSYKSWFTCSEQFFRTWTSIMYEEHESLSRKCGDDEAQIRRYLMSGNRLCTNGFRKWTLGCQQSVVESDSEELSKRFYRLHTENVSREWVHVYAALVLMMRYRELPDSRNVPNNLDSSPKMTRWDLPEGWVDKLVSKYNLLVKTQERMPEEHKAPPSTLISLILDPSSKTGMGLIKELTGTNTVFARDLEPIEVKEAPQFAGRSLVQKFRFDDPLTLESLSVYPEPTHKYLIGTQLYSLIETAQPVLVSKITGMFLEAYPVDELLSLLRDRPKLASKIEEALGVLKTHTKDSYQ